MFHNQLAASTERLESLGESLGPTYAIMQTLENTIKEATEKAYPNLHNLSQEVKALRRPPGGAVEVLLAAGCFLNPQLCEEEGLPVLVPVGADGVLPDSQKVLAHTQPHTHEQTNTHTHKHTHKQKYAQSMGERVWDRSGSKCP